jgi:transcriptional regulator with XRE-family HTH domain
MIELKEDFNKRLDYAMAVRGMRPVDLAMLTDISESTISQYRSGYAKPKEKKLALIANALNVDPSWLMGMDVPMEIRHKKPGESGSMAERESLYLTEIIDVASSLPEEQLSRLLAYARGLYDGMQ